MCRIIISIALIISISVGALAAENSTKTGPLTEVAALLEANRTAEALKILSAYRPSPDSLSEYHFVYAKALNQSGSLHDSIEHLRLAGLYSPLSEIKARILFERADVYMKMGYYPEASVCFRIFMREFQSSSLYQAAGTGLADSLFRMGRFHEALELYEKAGNETRVRFRRANTLQAMGRIEEAYSLYSSLLGRDRGYPDASDETAYFIGENFRQKGKLQDARFYFALVKDPVMKSRADLGMGRIDLQEKNLESALQFFRSAAASPDWRVRRSALLGLAEMHMNSGRTEEAEAGLIEIRKNYPYGKEYDDAIFMLAGLYKKQGDVRKGLPLLKELVFRRSPDRRALDEFEAMVLDAGEKDADTFRQLWESVGTWLLDPSRHKALRKIAHGLQHDPGEFVKIHTYLSKYGPQETKADSLLALAGFYAETGDAAASSDYLRRVTEKAMKEDIFRIRARLSLLNGEYDKAIDMLSAVKKSTQEDVLLLAEIVGAGRSTPKGIRMLEKVLEANEGPPSACVTLADKLYEAGRKADAVKYYSRAVSGSEGTEPAGINTRDREWAIYRLSVLQDGEGAKESLAKIAKNRGMFGSLAEIRAKEQGISERIRNVL